MRGATSVPAVSPGEGRDEGGDAFGVVEIEYRQPVGACDMIGSHRDNIIVARGQRLLRW